MLKLAQRNLDTYKQMVKESLSVLHFRIFAKKKFKIRYATLYMYKKNDIAKQY